MLSLLPEYFFWHYRYGIKDVRTFFGNLVWFLWNLFSITLLLKTLFVPWQRLDEHGQKGNLQSFAEAFLITTIMRLIGAMIRLLFIIIGLIVVVVVACIGIIASIVWIFLPLILLIIFMIGLYFIIYK